MHKRKKMLSLHDKKYISLKKNPSQHSILHFILKQKNIFKSELTHFLCLPFNFHKLIFYPHHETYFMR